MPLFLTGLLVSACSAPMGPTQELAAARQAIRSASSSGASEYATSEIALAKEKLEKAEDKMDDARYREARLLSEQAQVDAEYAQARAEALREEAMLRELRGTAAMLSRAPELRD